MGYYYFRGNYKLRDNTKWAVGVCQKCHPLCDPHKSCSGPLPTDCVRCDILGIKNKIAEITTDIECVSECPPQLPFNYEGFCYKEDRQAIRLRKQIIWSIVGLLIFTIVCIIIVVSVLSITIVYNCSISVSRYSMCEIQKKAPERADDAHAGNSRIRS